MKQKMIKAVVLYGLFALPGVSSGDSYTTDDGHVVECNGYDSSGNWVPCPDNSDSSESSWYESAKQQYKEAKEAWDTDSWLNTD